MILLIVLFLLLFPLIFPFLLLFPLSIFKFKRNSAQIYLFFYCFFWYSSYSIWILLSSSSMVAVLWATNFAFFSVASSMRNGTSVVESESGYLSSLEFFNTVSNQFLPSTLTSSSETSKSLYTHHLIEKLNKSFLQNPNVAYSSPQSHFP